MATTSIIKGKGERRGISQRSDPPPNEGATHWGGAARGPGRTTTSTAPAEFASRENTCTRRSPRRPKLDTRSSVAFLTCYRKFTITAAPTESITNHTTTARLGVAPASQSMLRTWLADTFVSSHLRSPFIVSQCTLQLLGVHTIVSLEPSSTPVSLSQQHSHSSAPPLRHSEPEYLSTQHTHTSSEPTRWTSRTSNTLMKESFMPADTKPAPRATVDRKGCAGCIGPAGPAAGPHRDWHKLNSGNEALAAPAARGFWARWPACLHYAGGAVLMRLGAVVPRGRRCGGSFTQDRKGRVAKPRRRRPMRKI